MGTRGEETPEKGWFHRLSAGMDDSSARPAGVEETSENSRPERPVKKFPRKPTAGKQFNGDPAGDGPGGMPKPPAKAKLTARELLNRLKASGDWNDSQKGKVLSLMRTMLKKHERLSCFGSDVARALELTVEGEPPLPTRSHDWFSRTEGYRDDFGHSAEANEIIREAIQSLREQESFDDDSAKGGWDHG